MGSIVCKGLRTAFGQKVGCQGVGGAYTAALKDNGSAKGTTDDEIMNAKNMFTTATTKCPNSIIVFDGYR
jgi:cutinase